MARPVSRQMRDKSRRLQLVGILRPRKHRNGVELVLIVSGRDAPATAGAAGHRTSVGRSVHPRVMPERGYILWNNYHHSLGHSFTGK